MKYLNRKKPKKYQNAGLVKKVIGNNLYMVDQENLQIFDVNGQQLDAQDFPDIFPQTQSKKFDPLQEILNRNQNKKATINSLATVKKSERDQRIQERKLAKDAYNNDGYFQLPTGETKKYSDMDWREKSYVLGKSLENKLRLFPNSESIIDDLNPLMLAGSLGTAPLESKMSDSVLPYLTSVGTGLATGALAGIGAKSTGQFVNNMVNPIAGMENPFSQVGEYLTTQTPLKNNFKSEIDWGKWNPEIPENTQLLQEYNIIEQTSKANGSWMKNSDGTPFNGTPEHFVQQNSENFKKAFPNGINKVYRGVGPANNNPDFSKGFIEGDKAIFTADKELAQNYAWGKQKENILTPFSSSTDSGIYELGFPKGDQINYNTMLSDWTDINLAKGSSKLNLEMNLEQQKKALERYLKNYEGSVDDDLISNTKNRIKQLEQYIRDFDNIPTNHEELKKMRSILGDTPSTDDIAAYLPKTNLNNVTLQNVIDGGLGDVTIVNNRVGNYLKSLRGNNGMFDMTNPNIYKTIIPASLLYNLNSNKQQLEKNGGLTNMKKSQNGNIVQGDGNTNLNGLLYNNYYENPLPHQIVNNSVLGLDYMFNNIRTNNNRNYSNMRINKTMNDNYSPIVLQNGGLSFEDLVREEYPNLYNFMSNGNQSPNTEIISDGENEYNPNISLGDFQEQFNQNNIPNETNPNMFQDYLTGNNIKRNNSYELFKSVLSNIESNGNYEADNPDSTAVGKYQFVWSEWGDKIKDYFGDSKLTEQKYKKSPELQEAYFSHYYNTTLIPQATKLKERTKTNLSLSKLMALVHFKGYSNAKKILDGGADPTSKNNISVDSYINQIPDFDPVKSRYGNLVNNKGYTPGSKSFNNPINIIPSNNITMKQTPFDLLGIDNLGNQQIMKAFNPNNYQFPGDYVTEVPIAQNGGSTKIKAKSPKDLLNQLGLITANNDNKTKIIRLKSGKLITVKDNKNAY